jgi:hypothetical protein
MTEMREQLEAQLKEQYDKVDTHNSERVIQNSINEHSTREADDKYAGLRRESERKLAEVP